MMNRARQLRLDRRLGLVDTAEAARIHTRTLKKIEAGEDVHPDALGRLASYYKVQPSSLLAPAVFDAPEAA